jgi:hypothetical protein
MKGVVIKTRVSSPARSAPRRPRSRRSPRSPALKRQFGKQIAAITNLRNQRLGELLEGQSALETIRSEDNSVVIRTGHKFKADTFESIDVAGDRPRRLAAMIHSQQAC